MKKTTLMKKAVFALALVVLATLSVTTSSVHAAQIDYNDPNNQPIHTPTFNTYTNVPAGIGNEGDFVMLRKSTGDPTVPAVTTAFSDPVNATCAVGEKFDVRTYVHNGANTEFNNDGTGTAIAHNVNVAMTAPLGSTAKNFTFRGVVSASNAASVTDTGNLNCANSVQLKLVPQTVKVYSRHIGWSGAPDSAVNGNLPVGSRVAGSGTQWGCWDDRIIVVYVVEVVEAPKTPIFTCDAIMVEKLGERQYRFGVKYTAQNGAVIKSVKYDFGDTTNQTISATPFVAEHTYGKDGEFKITTDLAFTVNGQEKIVTDAKCATSVKTDVITPCPTKPSVPKNSPDCTVCEYNSNLPKDSKDCVKPPVTVIPSTGVGGITTGLIGTSAAGYGAYAYLESKRSLKKLISRK